MSLSELVEKLAEFEGAGFPVISLYLNAQADQHGHPSYSQFVPRELRERAKTFQPHTPERESIDRDVERITEYLEKEVRPSANGVVIFACAGADDFFEAVQLDAPIENNRLYVYPHPHLYPLVRLMDQYPRYAVVLADTNAARIFVFGRGAVIDSKEIQNVKTKKMQGGGWAQKRYQRHIDHYHLHHAKEVIETLEQVVRQDAARHIILAGDEATIIPLLRDQMPKHLSEMVIDVLQLHINTPEHEILEQTLESLREHDAQTDAEKVQRLLDEYRAGGLAVVGVSDTLSALSNGQAEEVLLSASLRGIRYDEEKVEKVLAAYAPGDAAATQTDVSEPRMVADEIVTRAQSSSATVTFIEDTALLSEVGGVGALLRYRF